MNSKNIIKDILKVRGWNQDKLAEEAGFKSRSNITGLLNRYASMRVDSLVQMAEAMGCEVVIRDKMGSKQEWRVTDGREEK